MGRWVRGRSVGKQLARKMGVRNLCLNDDIFKVKENHATIAQSHATIKPCVLHISFIMTLEDKA